MFGEFLVLVLWLCICLIITYCSAWTYIYSKPSYIYVSIKFIFFIVNP